MGTYYAYVNDSKKEIIFPDIDDGDGEAGPKKCNFLRRDHPIHVLLFIAFFYKWHGDSVRLCEDGGEDAYYEYKDVTADLVKIANENEGFSFAYRNNVES
jgi:hypothetical protein